MTVTLPGGVRKIIGILAQSGYDGYAVGGCVRDSLLGKPPHDWDVCTDATPEQMLRLFKGLRVVETGLRHGTLTVIQDGMPYEVTTYRVDGEYLDNRRPSGVTFVTSLTDDLARRDFTVNAMAYSDKTGLVDPFGGEKDLAARLIRCVGNPDDRFGEDALRVLRALRFSAVLGFTIEPATAESIRRNKRRLRNISAERISAEFNKLICGENAGGILRAYADVIAEFIPELVPMSGFLQHTPYHPYDVWEHTVVSLEHAPADIALRLTMLLHDAAKPQCFTLDERGRGHFHGHPAKSAELARRILQRLKYDNRTADKTCTLILHHDADIPASPRAVKKLLNKIGADDFKSLLLVRLADYAAQNPAYYPRRAGQLHKVRAILDKVLEEKQCFALKDLAVGGDDLMALGIPEGSRIGSILSALLAQVISDKAPNDREALLQLAETLKDKQ